MVRAVVVLVGAIVVTMVLRVVAIVPRVAIVVTMVLRVVAEVIVAIVLGTIRVRSGGSRSRRSDKGL